MWIPHHLHGISRFHFVSRWSYDGSHKNPGYSGLAWTPQSLGHPVLPGFHQLLPVIHLQLLQHCHSINPPYLERNSVTFLQWLPECLQCYQEGIYLCSGNHSLSSGHTDYSWNRHLRLCCCSHPLHHPLQQRNPPCHILLPNLDNLQTKLRHSQ